MNNKPILFSGIQPSGNLTLGNYIGAIKNWIRLQQDYDCLFSVVDLHAITVRQDPELFRKQCYDALALNIACGIDLNQSIIFMQSQVAEHSQLAWVLNCYTQMGELSRMTQFKDKSQRHASNINAGLFAYPVLMAADILLYKTSLVPVGEDQTQHVEITRDIATRFNNIYGEIFTIPELYVPPIGKRIMSLQDPTKKMSKSDENQGGVIFLLDPPEVIAKKCKRAVTDSDTSIYVDPVKKPGVTNLLTILAVISDKTFEELESEYQGAGYGKLKTDVGDALIEFIRPVQETYHKLRADETTLNAILKRGALAAAERARSMYTKVLQTIGFVVN